MFINMVKKAKKQSLETLIEMLEALQEKEKIQDCMVKKFQKLIHHKDFAFSVIEDFPYPMAIFKQDGDLVYVNNALSEKTGLYAADLLKSKHSILNRITDANLQILDAEENVFAGKTTFLTGLSNPLDIFMSERTSKKISEYREALFFPVVKEDETITQGAVIFMK